MTVAWDAVESACHAWAQRVLNGVVAPGVVPSVPVVWKDRSHADVRSTSCELSIEREDAVGVDDIEYEDGAGTLTPRITGARTFVLEARIRSRDQSATRTARNHLEKLRGSLGHPLYLEILESGGVAFHTSEPVRTLPYLMEGRTESVAVLEIRCGVTSTFYDETASIDYAETADIAVSVDGGAAFVVDLPEST